MLFYRTLIILVRVITSASVTDVFLSAGSSKVQDLHFRSQWYMVSQKGIRGFTPFEKVTMAQNGNWGDLIDERFCVP